MIGWSPGCYIPSFVEISPPVPEKKIFEVFFPHMGVVCHLGHVTSIMSSDFHFFVSMIFHTKFGLDRHSGFWENPAGIFICIQPWAKVKT